MQIGGFFLVDAQDQTQRADNFPLESNATTITQQ